MNRLFLRFIILLIILNGRLALVNAQTYAVRLDTPANNFVIRNAPFIADKNSTLTFQDISSPKNGKAFITPAATVNVSSDIACYWLKIDLVTGKQTKKWLLNFDKWQYVDVYLKTGNNRIIEKHTGRLVPYIERDFKLADHCYIDLNLPDNAITTCYIRLRQSVKDETAPEDLTVTIANKNTVLQEETTRINFLYFFVGIYLVMLLYNFFIYVSIREKGYLYYLGILVFLILATLNNSGYIIALMSNVRNFPFICPLYDLICSAFFGIMILQFAREFLKLREQSPLLNKLFNIMIVCLGTMFIPVLAGNNYWADNISSLLGIATMAMVFIAAIRGFTKRQPSSFLFLLAYGVFITGVLVFLMKDIQLLPSTIFTDFSMDIGSSIEAVLFSLALANRINTLKQENASSQQQLIDQLNEYNALQLKLNQELEEKVELRTRELRESQRQLVQREKLAALGEVMAGIAHEIQNPLNFVNNFSEVNTELADELQAELDVHHYEEAAAIVTDLKANLVKVSHHGKRADNIVKGMLMHSTTGSGTMEEVNMNAMVDETLRISHSSWKAKPNKFRILIKTQYDDSIGTLQILKQDFSRALLNIFNNAFYALTDKPAIDGYEPELMVTTHRHHDRITIQIRDNGTGIKPQTLAKIFQPFFTTKPTGEGTGLGLSLSYDAIKANNGDITADSKEGEFTEFTITLPIT